MQIYNIFGRKWELTMTLFLILIKVEENYPYFIFWNRKLVYFISLIWPHYMWNTADVKHQSIYLILNYCNINIFKHIHNCVLYLLMMVLSVNAVEFSLVTNLVILLLYYHGNNYICPCSYNQLSILYMF